MNIYSVDFTLADDWDSSWSIRRAFTTKKLAEEYLKRQQDMEDAYSEIPCFEFRITEHQVFDSINSEIESDFEERSNDDDD